VSTETLETGAALVAAPADIPAHERVTVGGTYEVDLEVGRVDCTLGGEIWRFSIRRPS
jgi:hypothetical protein